MNDSLHMSRQNAFKIVSDSSAGDMCDRVNMAFARRFSRRCDSLRVNSSRCQQRFANSGL